MMWLFSATACGGASSVETPTIVGQRMRLNGRAATIVGIAPSGFAFPKGAEVWQPLVAAPDVLQEGWFTLLSRLKPTATVAQASDEASALLKQLRSVAPPHSPQNVRTRVVSLKDAVVGDVRPVMGLFVAAALLLFLVGCLNVVILLLVRGTERAREISICAALGATPGALIRTIARRNDTVGRGRRRPRCLRRVLVATVTGRGRPCGDPSTRQHSPRRLGNCVRWWRRAALGVDRRPRTGVVDGSGRLVPPIARHRH